MPRSVSSPRAITRVRLTGSRPCRLAQAGSSGRSGSRSRRTVPCAWAARSVMSCSARLSVGGDQRADDGGRRGIPPGRCVAAHAVLGVVREDGDSVGEARQPGEDAASVRAECRAVDGEHRRQVRFGRRPRASGRPGERAGARPGRPERAHEGHVPADRLEAELLVQGPAHVGREQGHGRAARLGDHVLHQRAAESAAPVPGRDQHHPDRREVRAPAGQHHRPGQAAGVGRVDAEGLGRGEQQRPLGSLRQPAAIDRERDAPLQVAGLEPADGGKRVGGHEPRGYPAGFDLAAKTRRSAALQPVEVTR